jgi:hypothetical protein
MAVGDKELSSSSEEGWVGNVELSCLCIEGVGSMHVIPVFIYFKRGAGGPLVCVISGRMNDFNIVIRGEEVVLSDNEPC